MKHYFKKEKKNNTNKKQNSSRVLFNRREYIHRKTYFRMLPYGNMSLNMQPFISLVVFVALQLTGWFKYIKEALKTPKTTQLQTMWQMYVINGSWTGVTRSTISENSTIRTIERKYYIG